MSANVLLLSAIDIHKGTHLTVGAVLSGGRLNSEILVLRFF